MGTGSLGLPTISGKWLDSLRAAGPNGQKYGYGISQIIFGPNSAYFHGGEMPGYNSFMGYDPVNDVTLIIWTSLTIGAARRGPCSSTAAVFEDRCVHLTDAEGRLHHIDHLKWLTEAEARIASAIAKAKGAYLIG